MRAARLHVNISFRAARLPCGFIDEIPKAQQLLRRALLFSVTWELGLSRRKNLGPGVSIFMDPNSWMVCNGKSMKILLKLMICG